MENVSLRCGKSDNAPRLRFPEFSGEWVEKKIKEFANCYAGATPSTKERKYWENGTIPWLSSGEVNKKHISFTDNFITKIGYDSCSTKMIPANTVVMALAGQGKTRGTVAITEIELCTNQSLASIVTNETVDDKFLLYYLETQYSNLRAISSGDGTRGGLNLNIINEYSVFLASLPEQKKIAAFFTLLDRRIQKQRQLVERLKTYKRGVIKQYFSAQKDNTKWTKSTISNCLFYEQPQKYIVHSEHYSNTYETPVLTANKAFILGYTNELDGIYDKGDVLIYDDFTMEVKYVDFPFKVKSSTIKMLTPQSGIDLYFMFTLLKSLDLQPEGHQRSYISILEPMEVNIPCYEEQARASGIFRLLDKQIEKEQQLLHKILDLKSSLLQKMFI